jgi:acyl dehydratase
MRLRIDVRVDANADAGALLLRERYRIEHVEFGLALDIEAGDARSERLAHLVSRLADPREDHLGRVCTRRQHPCQLAARHDVETAAGFCEDAQHAERGVGLHRIADLRVPAFEATAVGCQCVEHPLLGVDEERCSVFAGERGERQRFHLERAVASRDMRMAGEAEGRHFAPPVLAGALLAAAGGVAAASAGAAVAASLRVDGRIRLGSVARLAASGTVGMYSGPLRPQPARPTPMAKRPAALIRI